MICTLINVKSYILLPWNDKDNTSTMSNSSGDVIHDSGSWCEVPLVDTQSVPVAILQKVDDFIHHKLPVMVTERD